MKRSVEARTVTDAVYDALYHDIINLRFQPGEKLSEARLAELYGVSRDPVRKSISRLIQDGLLISRPQCGTIVSGISIQQGMDMCEIRCLMETYAVRKAVENISEETLQALLAEHRDIERRMAGDDSERIKQEIYSLDDRMHKAIYEASGNSMIESVIGSYDFIIKRIQIANMKWHKRKTATMKEMGAILEALEARDTDRAVNAMSIHIDNIRKTVALPTEEKEEKE